MMVNSKELVASLIVILLAGCTTTNNKVIGEVSDKADALLEQLKPPTGPKFSRHYATPYIGSRIADTPPSRNIPAILAGRVPLERFSFDRKLTLEEFAARVSQVVNVPVVIADDVDTEERRDSKFIVNFGDSKNSITMDKAMDMVLWPSRLNWEWNENRILISHNMVKTWEVQAILDVTLDEGGAIPSGVTGGAVSGASVSKNASTRSGGAKETWDMINRDIRSIVGEKFKNIDINRSTGTITVRAPKEQLDAVDKYLKTMNNRLSKVVHVVFGLYRVDLSEAVGAGVDFQAVINNKIRTISKIGSSVVQTGASAIGGFVLSQSGISAPTITSPGSLNDGLSNLQGSNLILQALNQVGRASHSLEKSVRPRNLTKASIQTDNNNTFVCQTTPSTTSNGVTTPGSAQQCLLSTGFKLNLIPSVYDNGTIGISYKLEMSNAGDLKSFSTGGTTVQNADWSTLNERTDAIVRSGEPLVIASLKSLTVDDSSALGITSASKAANEKTQRTVIVMTAYTE